MKNDSNALLQKCENLITQNLCDKKMYKVGDLSLILDIKNPHEMQYYLDEPIIDNAILNHLIKKNDTVIDAGANIGFMTANFIKAGCKKVYAFEPIPELWNRIKYLSLQDERILAYNVALGSHEAEMDIYISQTHNQGHSLNPNWLERFRGVYGDNIVTKKIKVLPLDSLKINESINLIKVDVEGAECQFIEGARKFFLGQRPLMQIEIYDFQYDEVINKLHPYYEDHRRVLMKKTDGMLFLIKPEELRYYSENDFIVGPPTYIFYNSKDMDRLKVFMADIKTDIEKHYTCPINGNEYLLKMTDNILFNKVLDIGIGNGGASLHFAENDKIVTALGLALDSYELPVELLRKLSIKVIEEDFECFVTAEKFDAIWMSHVLEHTQNVGLFLKKAWELLEDNGWLFVMVPPFKHEVVGGHVTNGWNMGQLMYNLLLAGFDIKNGHFIHYGYNICAFVRKSKQKLPPLRRDAGDIELTSDFWPIDVCQGFNGNITEINWFDGILLEKALDLFRKRQYSPCIDIIQDNKLYESLKKAYFYLGSAYEKLFEYEKALYYFGKAESFLDQLDDYFKGALFYHRAYCLEQNNGSITDIVTCYQLCLKYIPIHEQARLRLDSLDHSAGLLFSK